MRGALALRTLLLETTQTQRRARKNTSLLLKCDEPEKCITAITNHLCFCSYHKLTEQEAEVWTQDLELEKKEISSGGLGHWRQTLEQKKRKREDDTQWQATPPPAVHDERTPNAPVALTYPLQYSLPANQKIFLRVGEVQTIMDSIGRATKNIRFAEKVRGNTV